MMDFKLLPAFSRLIRLPNLLIIVGTLMLIHYKTGGMSRDNASFLILLIGTALIAAAGNIINDIFDVSIDVINKPRRVSIGRLISLRNAWEFYFLFNGIALLGTLFWGNVELMVFFCVAIFLLYFYSYQWKRKPLIGNLVIAFLCALVVLEYWWIAKATLTGYWQSILLNYAGFAFLSTLARELIKDVEDMEGDCTAGCQTFVIQLGKPITKRVVIGILIVLLIVLSLEALFFYQNQQQLPFMYTILVLINMLFRLGDKTFKASIKIDYSNLSKSLKRYMLLGLCLLLLA